MALRVYNAPTGITKVCNICKIEKDTSNFYKNKDRKRDGRLTQCRDCLSNKGKLKRQLNKKPRKKSLKQTQYGLKGPTFKDLTGHKYDKLTVIDYAGYNEKYKISKWLCKCDCGNTVIRESNTLRRFKLQHSCGCTGTCPVLPNNQHAFKRLLNMYKQNAEKRGYKFLITSDYFRELIKKHCYYCNNAPSVRFKNCTVDPILANGVDRIDNYKDYTIENCVPCCKICNTAKNSLGIKEFKDWVYRIYHHWSLEDIVDFI